MKSLKQFFRSLKDAPLPVQLEAKAVHVPRKSVAARCPLCGCLSTRMMGGRCWACHVRGTK